MFGSLQTTGWGFTGPFRSLAVIVATAGSILIGDCAQSDTSPAVDEATPARPAVLDPCHSGARSIAPAEVAAGLPWRAVPCARQAGAVCAACASCDPGAWCAPVKTRGIGPRSPGGGPDD
jgi:hypothetical protein